jgi:hypothetical protein
MASATVKRRSSVDARGVPVATASEWSMSVARAYYRDPEWPKPQLPDKRRAIQRRQTTRR